MTAVPHHSGSDPADASVVHPEPMTASSVDKLSLETASGELSPSVSNSVVHYGVGAKSSLQQVQSEPRLLKRGLMGLAALGASGAVLGILGSSLSYRWFHVTTDYAVVNGRTITVKAPARGTVQDFFARPGASVRAGQPLARINFVRDDVESGIYDSPEEVALKLQAASLELSSGQQSLALLEEQMRSLDSQAIQLQSLAEDEARSQQAIADQEQQREAQKLQQQLSSQQLAVEVASAQLNEAQTKVKAAKQSYERYQSLYEQQLIARQKVDELKSDWEIAQDQLASHSAAVTAAQQRVQLTQNEMGTLASSAPQSNQATHRLRQQQMSLDLKQQRQKLQQSYQATWAELPALKLKVEQLNAQLVATQDPTLLQAQPVSDLPAPFSGVVYQTRYDAGEMVDQSDEMLTMLDCDDLWVETLVTSRDAGRIDEAQPVSVYLEDQAAPVAGLVELIEPVSSLSVIQNREQRLLPALPPQMQQQALARVTVRLEPADHVQAANRFCGVGQMASLSFGTQRSQSNLPFLSAFASKSSR